MSSRLKGILCLPLLIFCMQDVYADADLSMIMLIMPGMVVLFIPIVLIESWVLAKYLKINYTKTLWGSISGNLFSTVLGIPLTWAVLVGLELTTVGGGVYPANWWGNLISVTLQAPWMLPLDSSDPVWMLPTALAFLMIPFFFISWLIEGFFVKVTIDKILRPKSYRASLYANLASYTFLELCIFILFVTGKI